MDPTPEDTQAMDTMLRDWQHNLAHALTEIGRTHMPFGKYGPKQFPPDGIPIYDLPPEYLLWFRQKGFPKSKLGRLIEIVADIKLNGADEVLAPLRKANGGRHSLRPEKPIAWDFSRQELPLKDTPKDTPQKPPLKP